ncbi:MAG: lysophospholipid transporter LplT, partial [Cohnella sp.]|nr:lysophospholipid transporter LplT [Cohnella sp.]
LIPLNTMLQEEGKTAIGSGRTIAVQNFVENSITVVGLGIYLILTEMDMSVNWAVIGMGCVLTLFLLYLSTQFNAIRATYSRKETT